MTLTRRLVLLLAVLSLLPGLLASPAHAYYKRAHKELIEQQAPKYQEFLLEVEMLISEEEFDTFVELLKDYQRDAFIDRFWRERDPYPETARNEFRDRWQERIAYVRSNFERMDSDRARLLLTNGEPAQILTWERCSTINPVQIWLYDGSETVGFQFVLVFVKRDGRPPYRLWYPSDGLGHIINTTLLSPGNGLDLGTISRACQDGDVLARAIGWVIGQGVTGWNVLMTRIDKAPEPEVSEWVATFNAYSTDLPEDAGTFDAELTLDFPGRRQTRTVVQGLLEVPPSQLTPAELADYRSYNLVLNGEVLRDGALFESFRYKYDFPVGADAAGVDAAAADAATDPSTVVAASTETVAGPRLPLTFQRQLRPGDYQLILKVEDINSGKFHRVAQALVVPKLEGELPPPEPEDPEDAALLREAYEVIASGETTIRLVRPTGTLQAGLLRLETLTTGKAFDKVTFFLDGKPILSKRRPPYSVELDLGHLPRTRTLRVVGYDAAGDEMASDEMLVNSGGHRFAVRLVEPRKGKTYERSLQARAEITVPEGEVVERVEIFLGETKLATLYQEPFTHTILLPEPGQTNYVRAVAYLPDGNATEDVAFVNAPDYLEEVDVQFVELYTTVLDRSDRPVQGLTQDDFEVSEDGVPQTLVRFDQVSDRPFHAAILLDVSASMDGSMSEVQEAALGFFQNAVSPKDRATLITFNDRPHLAVKFTNDTTRLAGGLAGLKAERGTSLYDSLIFSLYYFNGIRGQKAILVLSDGKDESSRFEFEDALEYARRAGVTLYAIGMSEAADDRDSRKRLSELAEETGGRAFFIDSAAELGAIYTTIQEELRSQYLLAYQSSNTGGESSFREIEVELSRSGLAAKTLRGYYP